MPRVPGEDARPTVSAVIITRNRKETLSLVLARLLEEPLVEIAVVDNGSTDETAEHVRTYGASVRLLEPGANLGLGGRNLAAADASGDLLLMLDDDCFPLPGSVETLAEAFRSNAQLGVAGGLVRDVDAEGNVLRHNELGTFDWWLRAGRKGDAPPEGFAAFSFPEGACVIRRAAYLEAGGFFEPYFLASSEVDLGARLQANGWQVRYFPQAAFDHMKAESERQSSEINLYYRIRNHLWYIWLRFPTSVAVRRTIGYLAFDLVEAAYRRELGAWGRAVRDAWRQRDLVLHDRRPLPRAVLRRAELNRGRMHVRLLLGQLTREAAAPFVNDRPRSILANTGYRLLADVASKVASLVFFVVMARELGDSRFGIFTFALSFAILATTFANFGQDVVLTREVARDRSRLGKYFANTLALKVVLATASLTVAIGVAALAGLDRETLEALLLLGPAVLLELLMATCFASYQAFERLEFIPVALISQRFVTAAVGIAALLHGAGVVAVSAIYLAGAALGFALALWFLVRKVARPELRVEPRRWSSLMRASLAIGLAGVFAIVLFRVDTAMLAAFEPKDVVGDYGAAYRLLEATLFMAWSVGAAVYPVFSRLSVTSVPPVGPVFQRGLKLSIALTLPLAAGGLVLAGPLIRLLYGSSYGNAETALRLLTPAIALYPICYVTGYLLVSQNRQRVLTWVYGLVALENILANLVLIPWLSLNGAALGTSISQLLVAVAFVAFAQWTVGRLDWSRIAAGPVLSTLLAAGTMAALQDELALAVPAGTAVYLVALVLFERFLFPEDARAVLNLLPAASLGGFGEILAEPPGRAARPEAVSSVAPRLNSLGAPCVRASERPSHPGDEQHSAKPS